MALAGVAIVSSAAYPQAATKSEPATLTVTGDVPTRLTLTADDLAKMPRQTMAAKSEDGTTIQYEGVLLRDILKRAGVLQEKHLTGKTLASYILVKARDGYDVVLTLAELEPDFGNEIALVADKRDGKPLFEYQGPFRLVFPNDKAGARSVRMLESLELVQLKK